MLQTMWMNAVITGGATARRALAVFNGSQKGWDLWQSRLVVRNGTVIKPNAYH